MNRIGRIGMILAMLMSLSAHGMAASLIEAKIEGKRVLVTVDGALFTAYSFDAAQKYPYFFPVNGPISGQSVTTETSEPYPHHHSLFLGCDQVNGGNYWQDVNERGQILSQGPEITTPRGERAAFRDICNWVQPGKDPIMIDERTVTISAPDNRRRYIDFEITLTPQVDVHIGQTNHSFFAARMTPELSVKGSGRIVNAAGDSAESGTYGKASPWCDYSGRHYGVTEGLAIFQHPSNPWYPAPWFTRDYGFFSPTPLNWTPKDKGVDWPKDTPVRFAYRVMVHVGDAASGRVGAAYVEYTKSK